MTGAAAVWVLLADGAGDNNQLLRLASELGLPFRTLELHYNKLHYLPPRVLRSSLASLDRRCREQIRGPWPSIVIGIGNRSVPVALAIRRLSGGRSKLVRIGNPRLAPASLDLVITTEQYRIPKASNVLELPIGINTAHRVQPTAEEREWLDALPRPHRMLLLGGNTFMWKLDPNCAGNAARKLKARGGSVIAVSSSRTSKAVIKAVTAAVENSVSGFVWGSFPRYSVLLADADEICVTADSVAMISDAVATGQPVGLVEPEKTLSGKFFYGLEKIGIRVPVRDVQRFWTSVRARGLAGTVDQPVAGKLDADPLELAVKAVRRLIA
jgi:mitochondrial fission protein ELM1